MIKIIGVFDSFATATGTKLITDLISIYKPKALIQSAHLVYLGLNNIQITEQVANSIVIGQIQMGKDMIVELDYQILMDNCKLVDKILLEIFQMQTVAKEGTFILYGHHFTPAILQRFAKKITINDDSYSQPDYIFDLHRIVSFYFVIKHSEKFRLDKNIIDMLHIHYLKAVKHCDLQEYNWQFQIL
jgi:hypothetical protein